MNNFEMVQEFHDKFEMEAGVWPYGKAFRDLRANLIQEEFDELMDEVYDPLPDKKLVAKELADLLYVVYGMADAFGIPINTVFKDVHLSNMSKLGPDGKPVKREDGKTKKGPNYKTPNLDYLD